MSKSETKDGIAQTKATIYISLYYGKKQQTVNWN